MGGSLPKALQRHEQIVRQWRVLLAIDRAVNGVTFAQLRRALSADLSVTERTIRRDVAALTLAGFPINVASPARGRRDRGEGALITLDRSNWKGGDVIFGERVTH